MCGGDSWTKKKKQKNNLSEFRFYDFEFSIKKANYGKKINTVQCEMIGLWIIYYFQRKAPHSKAREREREFYGEKLKKLKERYLILDKNLEEKKNGKFTS